VDFSLILVLGTILAGVVWLIDTLFFARPRRARAAAAGAGEGGGAAAGDSPGAQQGTQRAELPREPLLVEYARSFFPVLALVLVLRSFIFEPFRIPSGSMMPTLLVGDFILVNKYAYGVRLPVVHTKIVDVGEPQRGDIAVFRYPRQPELDYIKRIVGLPGDQIAYYNKTLFINGEPAAMESQGYYEPDGDAPDSDLLEVREQLGEVEHRILISPGKPGFDGEYVVPEGHYFAVGDNRDNSNDSRFWGFVPEENLVGKAVMIWFNWNFDDGDIDLGRVGAIE